MDAESVLHLLDPVHKAYLSEVLELYFLNHYKVIFSCSIFQSIRFNLQMILFCVFNSVIYVIVVLNYYCMV